MKIRTIATTLFGDAYSNSDMVRLRDLAASMIGADAPVLARVEHYTRPSVIA